MPLLARTGLFSMYSGAFGDAFACAVLTNWILSVMPIYTLSTSFHFELLYAEKNPLSRFRERTWLLSHQGILRGMFHSSLVCTQARLFSKPKAYTLLRGDHVTVPDWIEFANFLPRRIRGPEKKFAPLVLTNGGGVPRHQVLMSKSSRRRVTFSFLRSLFSFPFKERGQRSLPAKNDSLE